MVINLTDKPLIFLGDTHGNWNELLFEISTKKLSDCTIISVGDLGMGFLRDSSQKHQIDELNKEFKKANINFLGIRGNHDDPRYFAGADRIQLSNFELVQDYTVAKYKNKTIQLIGGAISIDRTGRKEGVSYWSGETVDYNKEKLQKIDVLVTHTAPSWCFPQTFNEMVYGWAREDAYLLEDLTDERAVMDEICKVCDPSFHFYGHFHSSWREQIGNCRHNLLNIDELLEFKF